MTTEINSKVAIIIPAKDEEHTIGEVLDNLLLNFDADNLTVVDDESSDRTAEIARWKNVRVMQGKGKGKGAAIKAAIKNVRSDILVFIDADGSHKPEDIPALIQPIIAGNADLVIASRIKGGSEEFSGNISNKIRFIGNLISAFIINLVWGRGKRTVTDCQNGFRAIKTRVCREINLKENSFAIEQEMVIKCLKMGYRISEISSYEFKRKYGNSHINPMIMLPKYIWCFIKNIVS